MDAKTQKTIDAVTRELKDSLGDDLESLLLYGSAVRGDYRPGRSDLNFLVVTARADLATLEKVGAVFLRRRRERAAMPMVLTARDLRRSLDSYPLELLEMHDHHQLLAGRDVVADLEFDHADLRLQCEREARGKLIQLRRGLMEASGDRGKTLALFEASVKSFQVIMRGVLHLEGARAEPGRLLEVMADKLGGPLPALERISRLKAEGGRVSKAEMAELASAYLREVERLCDFIDSWREPGGAGS